MIPGFEQIVEERIRQAQKTGAFDNLPGAGEPIDFSADGNVPEDLRLAYKILKNADCLPPEIEIKKEIRRTEDLLAGMSDTADKYNVLKRLNFLIMKFNAVRGGAIDFEVPQHYAPQLIGRLEAGRQPKDPSTSA
jgi:hypothetical protein